jgi:hypothetical protein
MNLSLILSGTHRRTNLTGDRQKTLMSNIRSGRPVFNGPVDRFQFWVRARRLSTFRVRSLLISAGAIISSTDAFSCSTGREIAVDGEVLRVHIDADGANTREPVIDGGFVVAGSMGKEGATRVTSLPVLLSSDAPNADFNSAAQH